jgi:hypothetical protein
VPLVDVVVLVEVVGDRDPGDALPAHARLDPVELGLGGARREHERGVTGVEVGDVRDLVRDHRAAGAAVVRPPVDARIHERAVDDELPAAVEQLGQGLRALRSVEPVLPVDREPRHPPALRRERVAGSGELLLLHEQLLAGGVPLLGGDGGRCPGHRGILPAVA